MTQNSRPPLVCHGHTRPVPELNFSHVTPDGYFLVSACKDGKAMLRRGETGDWIGTFDGHANACVWSCALNKPALLAATASADFSCKLWNAITGAELQTWDHPHIVRSVHFASASEKLATACHDKSVRLYDVAAPASAPTVFSSMRDTVRAVKFVADDNNLLLSYQNVPGLDLLDTRSGKVAQRIDTPAPATSLNISYDGSTVTTAAGTEVAVYDTSTLKLQQRITALQQVESASLCAEQGLLVVGGQDMWAYMLEYPSGKPVMVHKGHHGPVWSIQFAPDGHSFASASEDGTIRIWYSANRDASATQRDASSARNDT